MTNAIATKTAAGLAGPGHVAALERALDDPWLLTLADETNAITPGQKLTFRAPFAVTLPAIPRASLKTASSSGAVQIDVKVNGASILSAPITIDAGAKTSVGSASPAALATTTIADDAEVTLHVTGSGTGAIGLKVTLYTTRSR